MRKRTESLRLAFLGDPVVAVGGQPIVLKPKKVFALLAFLAVTQRRHSRDALAELLYSRLPRERSRAGLRQCLSSLRRALGASWIRTEGDAVWLDTREGLSVDVWEVLSCSTEKTQRHEEASSGPGTRARLEEIEGLFRGDFLAGFSLADACEFDSWQRSSEETLLREHVRILERLSRLYLEEGTLDEAVGCARRWLALDPIDEAGHRMLMSAYAQAGNRAEALRQYARCSELLRAELAVAPDRETEELRARIARAETRPARLEEPAEPALPPNNLPSSPNAFVGREGALRDVVEALLNPEVRIFTITGTAGTGKTRLALEAARATLRSFPGGVYFVDLSALREPARVMPAIARVFGVHGKADIATPHFDLVRDFLRRRTILLILDNFEYLLGAADSVARLVADCPHLTLLVTSREALRLQAEKEYLLRPFGIPARDAPLDEARANESVRLFVERARASRYSFALSSHNVGEVVRICERLDGLPLAIELAAARTRFLPPKKLLDLLETHGSKLLTGGSTDMPPRHRTLLQAIEWSHELLAAQEKAIFRRLSVFGGGWTLEDAEIVCRMRDDEDVFAALESIVQKNLVSLSVQGGDPWYSMLQAIREFAEERLVGAGEVEEMRLRHARYYLGLAERAEPELDRSSGAVWAKRLEQEFHNYRNAIVWSTEHEVEVALRTCGALGRFWEIQLHGSEGYGWIEKALEVSEDSRDPSLERWRAKAYATVCATTLAPWLSATCVAAGEGSVALWRKTDDERSLSYALLLTGLARMFEAEDPNTPRSFLLEGAALQRRIGDLMGLSHTTFWLAYLAFVEGKNIEAKRQLYEEARMAEEAGDLARAAGTIGLLGEIAADEGDLEAAEPLVERSLSHYRATLDGDRVGIFHQLSSLAVIAALKGNDEQAIARFAEAFNEAYVESFLSRVVQPMCRGFAAIRAARLDEAGASFREGIGVLRLERSSWSRQCTVACLVGIAAVETRRGNQALAARMIRGFGAEIHVRFPRLAWGTILGGIPTLLRVEIERLSGELDSALGDHLGETEEFGRLLSFDQTIEVALSAP